MPEARARVLILGGTAEGRAVAEALATQAAVAPVLSLAGLTEAGDPPGVVVRRGGFGGAVGLARYLEAAGFAALIDATHPFAARIHAHAVEAARCADVPCFRVKRRAWLPGPGDRWEPVDSIEAGLERLRGRLGRVFATLGRRALPRLGEEATIRFLVRGIVRPEVVLANVTWIEGRPPFPLAAELALFREQRIEALFVQASGGELTAAKLDAARELGLPVVMLAPPPEPAGVAAGSVADALAWLGRVRSR